jgi:uncharacterized membrane protein
VLGGLIAIMSAMTFALNNASVRRGVLSGSVAQAMAITVPIGMPIFFIVAIATGSIGAVTGFSTRSLVALSLAGTLHFVWGRYCNYRATKAIGTNLVAPVQQINLVFTLCLAIWLLGETLTPLRMLGIALVLIGPSLTMRDPDAKARKAAAEDSALAPSPESGKAVFVPHYAEGYLFALLSATGYGLSPILVRVGLDSKGLGASFAGGLVAYTAASCAMAVVMVVRPSNFREALSVKPEAAKWFTFSGFMVCFSQMFLYMAMSIAPVTVVSPINRLSILFRLYFSKLLNPDHEVFGGRVIAGTIVSLAGALALSLSTELVSSLVPLPGWLVATLQWHWP